ncbi:hypothetical protein KIMH_03040 [Bombiscardovia apis]|uniref:Uncharacterized protein n=1 Tax=Bombiscardovia apis TaxID=2932182 RepID=A0ABM8BBB7_9BIFI|nr:toxin [Bombiscardovia apis]BDR54193.1 hypothetical protein KIMH_03040 [Bombiscardovia apis]
MFIISSALKHDVTPEDAVLVVDQLIRAFELQEEPAKTLYLGFSSEGIPLEVVVLETSKGPTIIRHENAQ